MRNQLAIVFLGGVIEAGLDDRAPERIKIGNEEAS